MPLLNLCCGAVRPGPPWVNLDNLHNWLPVGSPERTNLDAEGSYVNWDLGHKPMPFQPNSFDGVLASHCVEHWDVPMAMRILDDCRRILQPDGVLMVSVPDASIFRAKHAQDTPENAVEVFGEPVTPGEGPTFLQYALLFHQHLQVLTEDSLWALLRGAGFQDSKIWRPTLSDNSDFTAFPEMCSILNRPKFSLVMVAQKS